MRPGILALVLCGLLPASIPGCGMREEEVDPNAGESRREMARLLNSLRATDAQGDPNPAESLAQAKLLWAEKVRPWMEGDARENRDTAQGKKDSLREFSERLAQRMDSRIQRVERELEKIEKALADPAGSGDLDESVREIIWALSHQPEGFEAPPPKYTWKDWAAGLGIGFGHLALILFVAFYLRRRYHSALDSEAGGS